VGISCMVTDTQQTMLEAVIARAPEWIRQELVSKDKAMRERAEEALAAMIVDAYKKAYRS
jgi:hypothetical protein